MPNIDVPLPIVSDDINTSNVISTRNFPSNSLMTDISPPVDHHSAAILGDDFDSEARTTLSRLLVGAVGTQRQNNISQAPASAPPLPQGDPNAINELIGHRSQSVFDPILINSPASMPLGPHSLSLQFDPVSLEPLDNNDIFSHIHDSHDDAHPTTSLLSPRPLSPPSTNIPSGPVASEQRPLIVLPNTNNISMEPISQPHSSHAPSLSPSNILRTTDSLPTTMTTTTMTTSTPMTTSISTPIPGPDSTNQPIPLTNNNNDQLDREESRDIAPVESGTELTDHPPTIIAILPARSTQLDALSLDNQVITFLMTQFKSIFQYMDKSFINTYDDEIRLGFRTLLFLAFEALSRPSPASSLSNIHITLSDTPFIQRSGLIYIYNFIQWIKYHPFITLYISSISSYIPSQSSLSSSIYNILPQYMSSYIKNTFINNSHSLTPLSATSITSAVSIPPVLPSSTSSSPLSSDILTQYLPSRVASSRVQILPFISRCSLYFCGVLVPYLWSKWLNRLEDEGWKYPPVVSNASTTPSHPPIPTTPPHPSTALPTPLPHTDNNDTTSTPKDSVTPPPSSSRTKKSSRKSSNLPHPATFWGYPLTLLKHILSYISRIWTNITHTISSLSLYIKNIIIQYSDYICTYLFSRSSYRHIIYKWTQRTVITLKILSLFNLGIFIITGRYRTLLGRMLGLEFSTTDQSIGRGIVYDTLLQTLAFNALNSVLSSIVWGLLLIFSPNSPIHRQYPWIRTSIIQLKYAISAGPFGRIWRRIVVFITSLLLKAKTFMGIRSSDKDNNSSTSSSLSSHSIQSLEPCPMCFTDHPVHPCISGGCQHIYCFYCINQLYIQHSSCVVCSSPIVGYTSIGMQPRHEDYSQHKRY